MVINLPFFGISAIKICSFWSYLWVLDETKAGMGMFLIVFNAYRDRAGIACPKKLDSWCGLDRFGIGQIY